MNGFAAIFLVLNAVALLALPRRWAPLPLLLGACYMTSGQAVMLGPFHFTVLRLLVLFGVIRLLVRGERLPGGIIGLDRIILFWGVWLIFSSLYHKPSMEAFVFRLGVAYNALGFYFLIRVFCRNTEDLRHLLKTTCLLLIPVAFEMVSEKLTARNLFSLFGGVPEAVMIRDGKLRAQGPFGHPILAGTVGAMCIPLMIGIWRQHRFLAPIGLATCLAMVLASTSSGPLMSVVFSLFALALWRWRHLTSQMRKATVLIYIGLDLVMKDPAYFIMARVDLTGSSTGWHRAQLIRSAFRHLDEWWLIGTDYTRHWMATGVSYSVDHTDITNHYLYYGVWGGLPLMTLLVIAFYVAFRYVGQSLRLRAEATTAEQFMIWSLGSALFSHLVTCFSVAYFDQSVMFLYLNFAAIGSLHATALVESSELVQEPLLKVPPMIELSRNKLP